MPYAPGEPAVEGPAVAETPLGKWSRSCVLCHVNGEGGAPIAGQMDQWEARIAQGEDVLLQHMVEGYNNMPPLGYCMDCSEADFLALTRFMAGIQ